MRFIPLIVITLAFGCSAPSNSGSEDQDIITYKVEDFSGYDNAKTITFVAGRNDTETVVTSNSGVWESSFSFHNDLDASLSAEVIDGTLIHMAIHIYENGEIVKSEEYKTVRYLELYYVR